MTNYVLIKTNQDLGQLCAEISQSAAIKIAVDCEFVREKTYRPILSLVQIAFENQIFVIDFVENSLSLSPLEKILFNSSLTKVIHSARQDLEIFYTLFGRVPFPIFDTQIAAVFAGFGQSVGYQSLVAQILNKDLDKTQQYTNWAQRPLSSEQLTYAAQDVEDLLAIFVYLKEKLQNADRLWWAEEEMSGLLEPVTYTVDVETVWQKFKSKHKFNRFQKAILQDLCRWREREAQKNNVNRGRVMRDHHIEALVLRKCMNLEDVKSIIKSEELSQLIWNVLQQSYDRPESSWPSHSSVPKIGKNQLNLYQDLVDLWEKTAQDLNLPKSLIASKDLKKLASGEDSRCLHGWRLQCFGRKALTLIHR